MLPRPSLIDWSKGYHTISHSARTLSWLGFFPRERGFDLNVHQTRGQAQGAASDRVGVRVLRRAWEPLFRATEVTATETQSPPSRTPQSMQVGWAPTQQQGPDRAPCSRLDCPVLCVRPAYCARVLCAGRSGRGSFTG